MMFVIWMIRVLPYATVVALLLSGAGCGPSVWVEAQEHLEVSAEGVDTLAVETHNGRIEVQAASDDSEVIDIQVVKRAGGSSNRDAEACLDALVIESSKEGHTHSLGWRFDGPRGRNWGTGVSFTVTVPARLAVKAETHNGRVKVVGLQGDCDLETHNGRIEADVEGTTIRAVSHNGRIDVAGSPQNIELRTHNGSIKTRLASQSELTGSITTHNGSIRVELADGASTRLTCSTHNGRVFCAKALQNLTASRNRLSGQLGESQGTLHIETHNGSIEVH